jgi:hypothetical protein
MTRDNGMTQGTQHNTTKQGTEESTYQLIPGECHIISNGCSFTDGMGRDDSEGDGTEIGMSTGLRWVQWYYTGPVPTDTGPIQAQVQTTHKDHGS